MEAKITPKIEIEFTWRDKDGKIKEQGTETMELAEVMKDGNINKQRT